MWTRMYLSVASTDVQDHWVMCTSDDATHLNVRNAVIHSHDRLLPELQGHSRYQNFRTAGMLGAHQARPDYDLPPV